MSRIYHVLPEGEPFSETAGGAISRWAANVLRGDKDGWVVACGEDGSWQARGAQVVVANGLRLYSMIERHTRHRVPWGLRKAILRRVFRGLIRRVLAGDVVWIHNRPEFAAALGADIHRARGYVVLHMHNSHLLQMHCRILKDLKPDGTVFVSQFLKDETTARITGFGNAYVLYNGADEAVFFPMAAERPRTDETTGERTDGTTDDTTNDTMTVLFAGRIVAEKGVHVLAEALRRLHERGVAVRGLIVGRTGFSDGKPARYLSDLMRDAPPNVDFLPYCSGKALANIFRQADVFCAPSIWQDPFPLAPLEAMASGLPVVATRSGGIPEALHAGGGLLVERNCPESLASALELLANDRPLRREMARAAYRAFRRHFTWSEVVRNYRSIAKQVGHA